MAKPVDKVTVFVGGDGVTPETVQPHLALELAGAYFDLLERIAEDRDQELGLHGLEIIPGSVGLASTSSFPKAARVAANEADCILKGESEPSSGRVERAYSRLARTLEALPQGHWAHAAVGVDKARALVAVRAPMELAEVWTLTTLRAVPFKVGGRTPKIWFTSGSELKPFGISTDEKTAREVARYLYDEIEVTFSFLRDEEGVISSANLDSFRGVEVVDDELVRWREWFREAGEHWIDVDDVDSALSRGKGDN